VVRYVDLLDGPVRHVRQRDSQPAPRTGFPELRSDGAAEHPLQQPVHPQRNIRFSSRYTLTLRLDSFNLFNRTNLGLPARNISGGDVATITSLSGDARITQLAIRFAF
jgi:hypothetical protein